MNLKYMLDSEEKDQIIARKNAIMQLARKLKLDSRALQQDYNDPTVDDKYLKHTLNKLINTYPDLIRNNRDVFYPNGIKDYDSEDNALNDYEESSTGAYYIDADDLSDPNEEINAQDFSDLKKVFADQILESKRKENKMFSNPTGIFNPADFMNKVLPTTAYVPVDTMSKVTVEKDTDNDGDLDTKVTEYE